MLLQYCCHEYHTSSHWVCSRERLGRYRLSDPGSVEQYQLAQLSTAKLLFKLIVSHDWSCCSACRSLLSSSISFGISIGAHFKQYFWKELGSVKYFSLYAITFLQAVHVGGLSALRFLMSIADVKHRQIYPLHRISIIYKLVSYFYQPILLRYASSWPHGCE